MTQGVGSSNCLPKTAWPPTSLVVDFMIRLNESVCVGQFAKKSRSFVHSFAFPVVVNHDSQSLSRSDSSLVLVMLFLIQERPPRQDRF